MISTWHIGMFVSWDARGLFAVGISDCERDLQTLSLPFTRQHIGRLAEARLIKNA